MSEQALLYTIVRTMVMHTFSLSLSVSFLEAGWASVPGIAYYRSRP